MSKKIPKKYSRVRIKPLRRLKLSFGELFAQSLCKAADLQVRAGNLIRPATDSLRKSLGHFFLFSPQLLQDAQYSAKYNQHIGSKGCKFVDFSKK